MTDSSLWDRHSPAKDARTTLALCPIDGPETVPAEEELQDERAVLGNGTVEGGEEVHGDGEVEDGQDVLAEEELQDARVVLGNGAVEGGATPV